MVSDSTLQLTFQELPLVKFWYNIKEKYRQLPEKAIKYFFFLPTTHLHEARLSLYTSTKTAEIDENLAASYKARH